MYHVKKGVSTMINEKILKILACPKCKNKVDFVAEKNVLHCENCNKDYKIREDIPIMMEEE